MKNKGITLISLVITIILLIILASVAIYLSLGDNGIFIKAKEAKEETNKQEATDIINLKITTAQMNRYADEQRMPTLKELSLELKEDGEIEYVMKESQVSGTKKYDVGENPSSIYTKLEKYPYEFEINSSLQLASINGVKIATSNNVTISKEEYDNLKNANKYSTNEIAIGTWIDGKPIYRKCFNINVSSFSEWTNIVDVTSLNVDTPLTIELYGVYGGMPGILNSGYFCLQSGIDSSKTHIQAFNLNNVSKTIQSVVFEYTKTTD